MKCLKIKGLEKSYYLCLTIYKVFAGFPKEERFGLTSQVKERPHLYLPT
ncbi:MAG: hypothetical protein GY849_20225 [Deltaproteobacteria bacterium]|nr:hypothetical protein [Deltaproteobacteria bacterium]